MKTRKVATGLCIIGITVACHAADIDDARSAYQQKKEAADKELSSARQKHERDIAAAKAALLTACAKELHRLKEAGNTDKVKALEAEMAELRPGAVKKDEWMQRDPNDVDKLTPIPDNRAIVDGDLLILKAIPGVKEQILRHKAVVTGDFKIILEVKGNFKDLGVCTVRKHGYFYGPLPTKTEWHTVVIERKNSKMSFTVDGAKFAYETYEGTADMPCAMYVSMDEGSTEVCIRRFVLADNRP